MTDRDILLSGESRAALEALARACELTPLELLSDAIDHSLFRHRQVMAGDHRETPRRAGAA